MRVVAASPEDMKWIERRAGCTLTPQAHAICAVDAEGFIRGMVAYDVYSAKALKVHMAVDSPIVWRSLIPLCFSIPFDSWGFDVGVALIPTHNKKSLRMAARLGFKPMHRVKDGFAPGVDVIHHELRREDCAHLFPLQNRRVELAHGH